jgi:glutaconate CoA-transferase subunit B
LVKSGLGHKPEFHAQSKRMQVENLHQGVTLAQVQDQTGFELLHNEVIVETPPPTTQELRILREEVDPFRYVLGR